jgi:hypothetical protein
MSNPNFDSLVATTLKHYVPKMADNIFKRYALLDFLNRKAKSRTVSGSSIVVPLMYETSGTFTTYSRYDTLDLTPQEGMTAAEYAWKQAAVSVAISGIEEAMNSGKEQVLDLLKAKITQAEKTAAHEFNSMFFTSDGTGNGGKDFLGLLAIVGDATHGPATVGGINGTTQAYWRANISDSAVALTISDIWQTYNDCTAGGGDDAPDFEITTQTLWQSYNDQLQPQQRFENAKLAEAGFRNLMHGGAPVTWDTMCPAGDWYFLNSDHLFLAKGKGKWFTMRKFVEPEDRDAKYALILSYGQLVTDERRKLGKLASRTAA